MEFVSAQHLAVWLFQRVPALQPRYADEIAWYSDADHDEQTRNPYFVLSFVVKPYMLELLAAQQVTAVQYLFDLFEYLATYGDASVQNEVKVTLHEMDIPDVWPYLGPSLRDAIFQWVTWFPDWQSRTTRQNMYVDKVQYHQRWLEEIVRIGGFEYLSVQNQLRIRYQLVQEFQILDLPASNPDGLNGL